MTKRIILQDKDENQVLPITNADCVYVSDRKTLKDVILDEKGVTVTIVDIDDELSITSENPVQNKVVTGGLNCKEDKSNKISERYNGETGSQDQYYNAEYVERYKMDKITTGNANDIIVQDNTGNASGSDVNIDDIALKNDLPTKTSDLVNDSEYISEDDTSDMVSSAVSEHNTSETAHQDMRVLIDMALGYHEVTSWEFVQGIVRSGRAPMFFNIGDQFEITKGEETFLLDIVAFDYKIPDDASYSHNMWLQFHNVLDEPMAIDAPEAVYSGNSKSAGKYYFNWGLSYDPIRSGDYCFEITKDIPSGGQICIERQNGSTTLDTYKVSTYNSAYDTEALETVSLQLGNEGTKLPDILPSTYGSISTNYGYRVLFGNNEFSQSSILQWLNSSDFVWQAQNKFDRPTDASQEGLLKDMDADFLNVIGLSDEDWKFTLPTADDISSFPYYTNNLSRIKYDRNGNKRAWWTSTKLYSYSVRFVKTNGDIINAGAYEKRYIAPVCVIA